MWLSRSTSPLAIPDTFPTLLLLDETITSLSSNPGSCCPFSTLYSNPSWDPCTVCARSPFPIHLVYILPCLYIPYSLAKYKGLTLRRYPVPRVHPGSPIAGLHPGTDSDSGVRSRVPIIFLFLGRPYFVPMFYPMATLVHGLACI